MPTQEMIAEYLYKKGLTNNKLSKQAISKRIKILKKAGLIGLDDDFRDGAKRYDPNDISDISDEIQEKY